MALIEIAPSLCRLPTEELKVTTPEVSSVRFLPGTTPVTLSKRLPKVMSFCVELAPKVLMVVGSNRVTFLENAKLPLVTKISIAAFPGVPARVPTSMKDEPPEVMTKVPTEVTSLAKVNFEA